LEDKSASDSDSEDEEEIEAKVFIYNDKKYLIDDNLTIYDIDDFDELGVYDPENKVINFK